MTAATRESSTSPAGLFGSVRTFEDVNVRQHRLLGFLSALRHPTGGSFVRPAKASFGVDFLTAVRQVYQIDVDEVLSEEISISSKKLKWGGVKERRYGR